MELPEELGRIHDTSHVSQLRKCTTDEATVFPLEDVQVDDHLNYVEKPIAILDWRLKTLRNKVVNLLKVQ